MSTRAVSLTALSCALLGLWLPSLWLSAEAPRPVSVVPPLVTAPPSPPESLRAAILRHRSSPMAMLQAAVAGVAERRFSVGTSLEDLKGLGFREVELLARTLAGEAAGRNVRDGAAFLKNLAQQDSQSFQFAALQAWTDSDPDAAFAGLIKLTGHDLWSRYHFISELAARDPDKALAAARVAPPGRDLSHLWQAVLSACADKGRDMALKGMQSAPAGERPSLLAGVLRTLASADPRATLAWLDALPPDYKDGTNLEIPFETWAEKDPLAAANEWIKIHKNKEPPYRVVQEWAYKDPENLYQWAREKGSGFEQSVKLAIESMSLQDPDKAMQMLAGVSDELRTAALPGMGKKRAQQDPRAALAWLHSLPAAEQPGVLEQMLPHLSGLPAADRRALAQELGTGTAAGFQFLYEADPAEAEKTLTGLPPAESMTVSKAMSERLAAASPAEAAPFVTRLVRALADPASAAALAAAPRVEVEFSDDNFGTGYSSSSSGFSAMSGDLDDPPEGKAPPPDPATLEVVETVARLTTNWSALDPVSVSAWIATLPAGKPQSAAVVNHALTWGRHDLPAARSWVEQLPPGEARDKAAAQITRLAESATPPPDGP